MPSPSGVADVFAFQCENFDPSQSPSCWGDVTVQAITSDGTTAWTASLNTSQPILPDFLGGLVYVDSDTGSIARVDGTTGQISVLYTPLGGAFYDMIAAHPDGTIFASIWDNNWSLDGLPPNSVIGFDPSGSVKFNVPVPVSGSASGLMIAGDGYAYVPYNYGGCGGPQIYLKLMRLTTAGTYDDMPIAVFNYPGWRVSPETCGQYGGDAPSPPQTYAITNADQGVTFTVSPMTEDPPIMAVTTGTSISIVNAPVVTWADGSFAVVQPVLQAQDGSYVGAVQGFGNDIGYMVSFDQTGAVRWMVPGNYQPQIATADGGLIATDPSGAAITFDQYGNATGVLQGSPSQSWTGNTYQLGSTEQVLKPLINYASMSYAAVSGGNPSGNGTYVPTLGAIYRATVANLASGYVGDSTDWAEGERKHHMQPVCARCVDSDVGCNTPEHSRTNPTGPAVVQNWLAPPIPGLRLGKSNNGWWVLEDPAGWSGRLQPWRRLGNRISARRT